MKRLIPKLQLYLQKKLGLSIHPRKIYLQHYAKGLPFLGVILKPNRTYIGSRTKSNFYEAIQKHNAIVRDRKPSKEEKAGFQSSMNSYLGIMKHYHTYRLRKKMLWRYLSGYWWNVVYSSGGYGKLVMKVEGRKKIRKKFIK